MHSIRPFLYRNEAIIQHDFHSGNVLMVNVEKLIEYAIRLRTTTLSIVSTIDHEVVVKSRGNDFPHPAPGAAQALETRSSTLQAAVCDDFIRKPYKDVEIFDVLKQHLDVRFTYEEEPPLSVNSASRLTASVLAELPASLLNELEQVLVLLDSLLDSVEVDRLIETIRTHYPAVVDALAGEVKNLQYGRILHVIKDVHSGGLSADVQTPLN